MFREPTRAARRTGLALLVVLAVAALATIAVLAGRLSAASVSSASPAAPLLAEHPVGDDGDVADGTSVFEDVAAVTNLEPGLLEAIRRAATDAAADGIEFEVNSGWRSPEYQEQLLRDAVAEYGSEAEAARWVATADTSPHVQGAAIDIGEWDAADWLSEHGADYGLCQIYDNEPWHFEVRAEAVDGECPAMYFDPTFDPRMQR